MNVSKPLNTGKTGVSFLATGPGNWSGRYIIGTQPARRGFSGIELEDRIKATLQQVFKVS